MIRLVWTSSAGVTWSLSMESATTNFTESSAVDHAQGRADLGGLLTRPSLGLGIQTTNPRGNTTQGLKNGQIATGLLSRPLETHGTLKHLTMRSDDRSSLKDLKKSLICTAMRKTRDAAYGNESCSHPDKVGTSLMVGCEHQRIQQQSRLFLKESKVPFRSGTETRGHRIHGWNSA